MNSLAASSSNFDGWSFLLFYYAIFAVCSALICMAIGIPKGHKWNAFFIGLLLSLLGILIVAVMQPTPDAQRKIDAERARRGASPVRAPVAAPAGWHPDPYGKHQLRYFDGTSWREMVSDDGVQSVDAPPPPTL